MNSLTLVRAQPATSRGRRLRKLLSATSKPLMLRSPKLHRAMYSSFPTFRCNLTASFPGFFLLLREKTLVAAGHVTPKIWEPKVREGKKSK